MTLQAKIENMELLIQDLLEETDNLFVFDLDYQILGMEMGLNYLLNEGTYKIGNELTVEEIKEDEGQTCKYIFEVNKIGNDTENVTMTYKRKEVA
ncbi:hypothetical protein [Listeria immobilis]|uniref:hypothetical protein n=1 Tax=Listeria immobilis TaxID=2713502 RepID=UPI00164ED920|nr:hypothetical protein [Listeria immobilis]MBC6313714.1 hypothetical protein [Listeria immobilis]